MLLPMMMMLLLPPLLIQLHPGGSSCVPALLPLLLLLPLILLVVLLLSLLMMLLLPPSPPPASSIVLIIGSFIADAVFVSSMRSPYRMVRPRATPQLRTHVCSCSWCPVRTHEISPTEVNSSDSSSCIYAYYSTSNSDASETEMDAATEDSEACAKHERTIQLQLRIQHLREQLDQALKEQAMDAPAPAPSLPRGPRQCRGVEQLKRRRTHTPQLGRPFLVEASAPQLRRRDLL